MGHRDTDDEGPADEEDRPTPVVPADDPEAAT